MKSNGGQPVGPLCCGARSSHCEVDSGKDPVDMAVSHAHQNQIRKDGPGSIGTAATELSRLHDGSIVLPCPAKLNVFLEVRHRRADGFHELDTVMLRTQFSDVLSVRSLAGPDFRLRFSDATPERLRSGVPLDDRNLILKAARELQRVTGTLLGAEFVLHKRIPPESGLAGGSSNAASALLACRALWNLDVSDSQLHEIAASLGSDINFLLSGARAAACSGRGEIIRPIAMKSTLWFVATRPATGNSTPEVFRQTVISPAEQQQCSAAIRECLVEGHSDRLRNLCFNRLLDGARRVNSEMAELMDRMESVLRRPVFMSGSGSTVFVLAKNRTEAQMLSTTLRNRVAQGAWILEV